jgi:hypothetical protein
MSFIRLGPGVAVVSLLASALASAADSASLVATSVKGEVIRHVAWVQDVVTEKGTIEAGESVETRAMGGVQLDFKGAIDLTLGPGAALLYHSAQGQQLRVRLDAGDFEARVAVDADLRFNVGPLRARAIGARVAARARADGATVCVLQGAIAVQTPLGEKRLDQPGQCLQRNGNEELVRGPGAPGASPLPPEPYVPFVGATALPPPPPAALSSPPPSVPPPVRVPPVAPPAVAAAPVGSTVDRAPHVTTTVALQPRSVVETPPPPPAAPVIERAPRVTATIALQPQLGAQAPRPPPPAAPGIEHAPRVAARIALQPRSVAETPPPVPPAAPATPPPPPAVVVTAPPPVTNTSPAGKPVFVTPFSDAPETTRVAVNPQPVPVTTPTTPQAATPSPATTPSTPPPPPAITPPVAVRMPTRKSGSSVDFPALESGWTVVIAALNSPSGATDEALRLRTKGLPADIFVFMKDGQRVYRLGLGRFKSYEAASTYAARVRKDTRYRRELKDYQPWIAAFGAAPT